MEFERGADALEKITRVRVTLTNGSSSDEVKRMNYNMHEAPKVFYPEPGTTIRYVGCDDHSGTKNYVRKLVFKDVNKKNVFCTCRKQTAPHKAG